MSLTLNNHMPERLICVFTMHHPGTLRLLTQDSVTLSLVETVRQCFTSLCGKRQPGDEQGEVNGGSTFWAIACHPMETEYKGPVKLIWPQYDLPC